MMKKRLGIVALMLAAAMVSGCVACNQQSNTTPEVTREYVPGHVTPGENTTKESTEAKETDAETTAKTDEETTAKADEETTAKTDEATGATTEAATEGSNMKKGKSGVIKTEVFEGTGSGKFYVEFKWEEECNVDKNESVVSWVATYQKPEDDLHPFGWAYVYGGTVKMNDASHTKYDLAVVTSDQAKAGLVLGSGKYTVNHSDTTKVEVTVNAHILCEANNFEGTGVIELTDFAK